MEVTLGDPGPFSPNVAISPRSARDQGGDEQVGAFELTMAITKHPPHPHLIGLTVSLAGRTNARTIKN